MIKKYIEKKPSTISAIQWKGDNFDEVDRFCTVRYGDTEVHYAELWNEPYLNLSKTNEKIQNRQSEFKVILKGDMWCGDEAHISDYIITGDEFYHVEVKDFEDEWEPSDRPNLYQRKSLSIAEAIQWTDNNTEEVLEFLGDNGGLERSKTQILIMNSCGGSVLEKGYYLMKISDEFYAVSKNVFEEDFKEL